MRDEHKTTVLDKVILRYLPAEDPDSSVPTGRGGGDGGTEGLSPTRRSGGRNRGLSGWSGPTARRGSHIPYHIQGDV